MNTKELRNLYINCDGLNRTEINKILKCLYKKGYTWYSGSQYTCITELKDLPINGLITDNNTIFIIDDEDDTNYENHLDYKHFKLHSLKDRLK